MEANNSYNVVILPHAENDITEVLDYISSELKKPTAAKNLWADIKEAISRIKLFPYAMPKIKNERITLGNEYRRLNVNNYAIIYNIIEDKKEVCIFAFVYAPSDFIAKIFDRI